MPPIYQKWPQTKRPYTLPREWKISNQWKNWSSDGLRSLVPTTQATNQKTLILNKVLSTFSKHLIFFSRHIIHIKQRGIMAQRPQTCFLLFPTLAPLHTIKRSMTFLEKANFNPNQKNTKPQSSHATEQ